MHVDETTYSGRYDQLTRFSVTVMATDPDHAEILAQGTTASSGSA